MKTQRFTSLLAINHSQAFKSVTLALGVVAGSFLAFSASAQAFSFKSNFTTDPSLSGDARWKGNIMLDSVEYDGLTVSDFALVNQANIVFNTPISNRRAGDTSNPDEAGRNNNTGAMSTDRGDLATSPIGVSGMNDPTGGEVATFLGNRNLSNIIDTEDSGAFTLDLTFDKALTSIFLFERGMNSKIGIQAIGANGMLIGNALTLNSSKWTDTGYKLNTLEIDNTQKVGSIGVSLADLGVGSPINSIRLWSTGSDFNGPDFKVMGAAAPAQEVPEPATMGAIALVGGGMAMARRRRTRTAG